ncbi:hypothetical protein E2C01_015557 [Portunus trituberculatus]|uniref:Uncharacterized protein n=1 Tax=Portunus trituberculatus TaxID=210409 RepID=A0A5B7DM01_PORTR|nr:hypothetical protein [Portunus trituberculatus]
MSLPINTPKLIRRQPKIRLPSSRASPRSKQIDRRGRHGGERPIASVDIHEEYMWEALFNVCPLVVQAILFIVAPILGPISPPKHIFGVTT